MLLIKRTYSAVKHRIKICFMEVEHSTMALLTPCYDIEDLSDHNEHPFTHPPVTPKVRLTFFREQKMVI